jgi:hypothetical protein
VGSKGGKGSKGSMDDAATREALLVQLRLGSSLAEAARALKIRNGTAYAWIREHADFADEVDRARGQPVGTMRNRRVGKPTLATVVEAEVIDIARAKPADETTDEDGLDFDVDDHHSLARRFARDYVRASSSDGFRAQLARILMGRALTLAQARPAEGVVEVVVGDEDAPREIAEGDWRGS